MAEDHVSLREFFERVLADRDALYEERDARYRETFRAMQESFSIAAHNAEKAIEKAETSLKEYKDASNEFRATLSDQANRLITRAEAETALDDLKRQVLSLQRGESVGEGSSKAKDAGRAQTITIILGLVGVVVTLVIFLISHRAGP